MSDRSDGAPKGDPSARATISRAEVLEIARLARLRLDGEEVGVFTGQLNDILAHAQEIAAAEAGGVDDTDSGGLPGPDAAARARHGGAAELRLRDPDAEPDALLRGPEAFAPAFLDGLFAVPRLEAMDEEPAP